MHIVIIYPYSQLSPAESRFVSAASLAAGVHAVKVLLLAERRGVVYALEQLRADVERAIARMPDERVCGSTLAANSVVVTQLEPDDLAASLNAADADVVINLTGQALPSLAACENALKQPLLLELWYDGVRPVGLGELQAEFPPPRDVRITCRRNGLISANADRVQLTSRITYDTTIPQPAASTTDLRAKDITLEQCTLTTTPGRTASDRRNAARRSITLMLRALKRSALSAPLISSPTATLPEEAALPTPIARAAMRSARALSAIVTATMGGLRRRSSRTLGQRDVWQVLYRTQAERFVTRGAAFTPSGFQVLPSTHDHSYADPFPFSHNGIDALFVEDYSASQGRGVISVARLDSDGSLSAPEPVLVQPHHLSYPFVFRYDGAIFMMPESSDIGEVRLYRCAEFPSRWEPYRTLLKGVTLADATLHFDGALWWLFATGDDEGAYLWDELHLYMADSPMGPFTAHPLNPVKCDARSARPAGPLFTHDGRLMRPTQDCSDTYGGAINLCEVDVLTPTAFREREVARIAPTYFAGTNGLHTLAASLRIEAIDVRRGWQYRGGRQPVT